MQHFDFTTVDGLPDGGHTIGSGVVIAWQRGPLTTGRNGAFLIEVLKVLKREIESDNFFDFKRTVSQGIGFAIDYDLASFNDVIGIAMDRLNHYQSVADSRFACQENQSALELLEAALHSKGGPMADYVQQAIDVLEARLNRRQSAGILGTQEGEDGTEKPNSQGILLLEEGHRYRMRDRVNGAEFTADCVSAIKGGILGGPYQSYTIQWVGGTVQEVIDTTSIALGEPEILEDLGVIPNAS